MYKWLLLAICLVCSCSFHSKPIPEIDVPRTEKTREFIDAVTAVVGEQQSFFDFRTFILEREQQSLISFLQDRPQLDHPKVVQGVEYYGPEGEVWGWKGVYNTNGYGVGEWVRKAAARYGNQEAFQWLRLHCLRNVYNYWIYYESVYAGKKRRRGPNEGVGYEFLSELPDYVIRAAYVSGIPEGQLVEKYKGKWLVPKAETWDGSSYGRHHCYDFIARCVTDPQVPLTDAEKELCLDMLVMYAETTMATWRVPKATVRHEYGHYYVRTFVAIHQLLQKLYPDATHPRRELATKCLRFAEGIVIWGWHPTGGGKPRFVAARNGDVLWVWDQDDPNNVQWHSLNQLYTERPWYVGLRASAWFYLFMEPDTDPTVRNLIMWVLREEAKWCSRSWEGLPELSITKDGFESCNGWVHGGMLPNDIGTRWIYSDTVLLTADQWAALGEDEQYHPLTCIKHRESDNGYFNYYWPEPFDATNMERWHYPKVRISVNQPEDFGPHLDPTYGSWAGMPDVLFLAGLINGDIEQVKTGIWMATDYLSYFNMNHSGETLLRKKSQALKNWYRYGYRNRDFYWSALACGEIMRLLVMDGGMDVATLFN